jgi:hypothetical protein
MSSVARTSCYVAIVGLILGCGFAYGAGPRLPHMPRHTNRPAAQPQQPPDDTLITELELAKSVLEKAKHDYDGHRQTSIDSVQKAIDTLKSGAVAKKDDKAAKKDAPKEDKSTSESSTSDKPAESKPSGQHKQSDDLLRDAHARLTTIHKQMTTGKGPAHHQKAATDVTGAMNEIETALKPKGK